jgi:hypothetical protein
VGLLVRGHEQAPGPTPAAVAAIDCSAAISISARWTQGSCRAPDTEEVKIGVAIVPPEQHCLPDDARAFDRPPVAAIAGVIPVVAQHVEIPWRDMEGVLPGGIGDRQSERVDGGQVRFG